MELQKFVKKGVTLMRPYVNGEDMSSISVSKEDKKLKTLVGGWIAYNPNDESDQWYISEVFFNDNYTPLEKKDLANASVALVDLLKDFLVEIKESNKIPPVPRGLMHDIDEQPTKEERDKESAIFILENAKYLFREILAHRSIKQTDLNVLLMDCIDVVIFLEKNEGNHVDLIVKNMESWIVE